VFHAEAGPVLRGERRGYCVFIPPPNVTAALHLGHALNNTLQDVLVRAHRMMGYETLWMPGTDHAGIATQAVVEKRLRAEGRLKGPLRESMTREAFVAQVQAWKDEYEGTITEQLKAMGCSCDWARQRFTMDDVCSRAVREAFFRLFRDGLIYRGKRLVNWDPVLQTAVADDETEDVEVDGWMYYLRYPLVRGAGGGGAGAAGTGGARPGAHQPVTWSELRARGWPATEDAEHADERQAWVTVATTRPETYLGDTAVAVNPRDPRAAALRGLAVELPLVGRVIPIIEDSYVVLPAAMQEDPEAAGKDPKAAVATGFLKVTPAHDANDYEIGQRHGLPLVNVMAPDGTISDRHGWEDVGDAHIFVGKSREEARKLVIREFKERTVGGEAGAAALFARAAPYRHTVPHSDRSKAAIEPYLSDQWYVKVTDERMAGRANAALVEEQRTGARTGRGGRVERGDASLRFHPARYARTYETWHENIRDWCISRQLWWGHRIPVWHGRVTIPKGQSAEAGLFGALGLDHLVRGEYEGGALRAYDAAGREVDPAQILAVDRGADRTYDVFVCYDGREPLDARRLEGTGEFVQDPDVLDTWFSSALWPLATLGWPDPAGAGPGFEGMLEAFNPSDVLCTAREIITLWVSRMVMFNRYFREGVVPFRDVFIHAMIQDGEGRKMSKSLGNGVDPLDIIATHGADAMRFTLCHMTTQTQDVRMPVTRDPATGKNTSPKFDLGRNFANKVWNAARFAMQSLGSAPGAAGRAGSEGCAAPAGSPRASAAMPLVDRWMLSRLAAAVEEVERALREYEFSDYAQTMYDLVWRDFCDWYLEAIKPTVAESAGQRAVLRAALDVIVRLLHPVMPFITEAIHERLREMPGEAVEGVVLERGEQGPASESAAGHRSETGGTPGTLLCVAAWPRVSPGLRDVAVEARFERIRGLVTAIREVRAQHQVKDKRRITVHAPAALLEDLGEDAGLVMALAKVESLTRDRAAVGGAGGAAVFRFEGHDLAATGLAEEGVAGAAAGGTGGAGAERERLSRVIAEAEKRIATFDGRLNNPGYVAKAPAKLVEETRAQRARAVEELEAARAALARLEP
jgi:valyl-tRNA synthetase